jgi:hypothetical protein
MVNRRVAGLQKYTTARLVDLADTVKSYSGPDSRGALSHLETAQVPTATSFNQPAMAVETPQSEYSIY